MKDMIYKKIYKTRSEWHEYRNDTLLLGSSDIGNIMGLNPFTTPYQHWRRMIGYDIVDEDAPDLIRGRFKEDAIAKIFEYVTGEKIIKSSANIEVWINDDLPPYMQAAPDRILFSKRRGTRIGLECKDTRMMIDDLSRENVPPYWWVQIQFLMGVTGLKKWYIAAENGAKKLIYNCFDFDEELFKNTIIPYCSEWFEKYILGDDQPKPTTSDDAALMWPFSTPSIVKIDKEMHDKIILLKKLNEQIKDLNMKSEPIKNKIKIAFEDNEAMEYDGHVVATYKGEVIRKLLLK